MSEGVGLGGVEPAPPRDSEVWARTFRLWDSYFAVVWVATVIFVLGTARPEWPVRLTALVLLVLLVPWYVAFGRSVLMSEGADERRALGYVAGTVLLFLPSGVLVGETRLMTFALIPQCFMALRMRRALAVVAIINLAPVAGWAVLWRPLPRDVFYNSVFAVVTLVFSAAIGIWVIRVIEQSDERAELIAQLDASREEVARLSADRGALAERERMSREIHDTLAQGFTSVLMLVQAVDAELERDVPAARRHLGLMEATARQNLAEARALVAGGAPADLDGGGPLPDALRRLAARHDAAFSVTGDVRPLPPGLEVVALRSCQEALANVRKHAGPGATATVGLAYARDALSLEVRDGGRGFDPGVPHRGYGLRGLRARAAEVRGTAEVVSGPGEGTTVTVLLPAPERSLR
ncbi:sensor histidine kinase [Streptomyces alboniger]|uniref:histidine kinase n=1 Tax=Streptomyces alboniger TaxID=132473 RepID=A0A5J6HA61_STRAD|nr:sensor histidine kinase [Streptomyces alboniger]QEV17046.1 sensor histidine kinase [Streptomyces alboniger]